MFHLILSSLTLSLSVLVHMTTFPCLYQEAITQLSTLIFKINYIMVLHNVKLVSKIKMRSIGKILNSWIGRPLRGDHSF